MLARLRQTFAGACAALLVGCGAANDDFGANESVEQVATSASAIHHGEASAEPAVVALVLRRESCDGPPPLVNCTGILIGARAVLTAAHCVDGPARGVYEVFFGASPGATDGSYRGIVGRVVDPSYDRQSDEHDIALVWLDAPAPVAPAALVGAGAVDASWVGRGLRVVGFGDAGDASTSAAVELEGSVSVTRVDDDTLSYGPSPGMTCQGDSGGPVFVDRMGVELVAAVTTSGDRLCEENGVAVRVDARLGDFIEPALAAGPPVTAPSITPEAVCSADCRSDGDCPSDLACRADLDGTNRCQLPSIFAGEFGASCTRALDCGAGASCVPFGDACRCERACVGADTAGGERPVSARAVTPDAGAACRAAPPTSRAPAWTPLGFALLAAWGARSRRRDRNRRTGLFAPETGLTSYETGRSCGPERERRCELRRN